MDYVTDEFMFIESKSKVNPDNEKKDSYWENASADINGMLGGFGFVSSIDISESIQFIDYLINNKYLMFSSKRCLDCGAGIGRITLNLLNKYFEFMDILEENKRFIEQSYIYLKSCENKVKNRFNCKLQNPLLGQDLYDVIWIQWILGYLNDDEIINCIKLLSNSLCHNGLIVIKENTCIKENRTIDAHDGGILRTLKEFKTIIEKTGLVIVCTRKQINFPKNLIPVHMLALKKP